jgi:DNA-binding IclR family transcriptional regulator
MHQGLYPLASRPSTEKTKMMKRAIAMLEMTKDRRMGSTARDRHTSLSMPKLDAASETTTLPASAPPSNGGSTQIQSVARASRLLRFVAQQPDGCRARDAARAIGVSEATTYHLLNTLVAERMLEKDERRVYRIGAGAEVLAESLARQVVPRDDLMRPLRALAAKTKETAYVVGWRGGAMRVLAIVEGAQAVRVATIDTGSYAHPHARASGKLLLAFTTDAVRTQLIPRGRLPALTPATIRSQRALAEELARIREQGFAEDREEFAEGVSCVSAPIYEDATVLYAITVSAPSDRYQRRRQELIDAALEAAAAGGR